MLNVKQESCESRALAEKFTRGGGGGEEGNGKTRSKNSTIKPPSTLSVTPMKIQGSHGPFLPPTADAYAVSNNF